MPTGDGLLARLIVHEPMSLAELATICAAAAEHGNGILEVTQRGNLQVRGLDAVSAPKFAQVVASLPVGQYVGPPLLTSPLLGLDPGEPFQSKALALSLLGSFRRIQPTLTSLGPKVSVLIDGGGRLHLDALSADIRLVACHSLFELGLAGNARSATRLGYVAMDRAIQVVELLLQALASQGPEARARDLLHQLVIRDVSELLHRGDVERAGSSPTAELIGAHPLKEDRIALGFALPFGHTTANILEYVVQAAEDHGATAIRPAPGRALLAIGLRPPAANKLRDALAAVNLIVDSDDHRRYVVACAGSPACGAAKLPTRQLAEEVARARLAGPGKVVHLAGCSKGCAHPSVAALTVVGPDRIILNGRASDSSHTTLSSAGWVADLTHLSRDR
jgi:precorrin-3B synthase